MAEPTASSCPSLSQLEQWVAGDGAEDFEKHVNACDACAATVRDIKANNDLLLRFERSSVTKLSSGSAGGESMKETVLVSIDGYDILDEVHRGGQGVVYRGVQNATNRPVAIKVLLAGALATSRQRRRFEREIELVANLSHPNIITVYDSGTSRDGRHYLVMEHIDGQPLDQWLTVRRLVKGAEHRLDVKQIVKLFGRICNGVSFAHQHGVIHRDLKPHNILVDDQGQPRILDFGLAKDLFEDRDEAKTVSVAGEFMGTLAYAAPEQTTGDPSQTDVRSDVYALGIMLYQALTGSFPYPIDVELVEALNNIRSHEPKPMRAVVGSARRVDPDLETIVRTALAKEKERRYQSVAALRDDLHHWMMGEPIAARRDSGWYVLRKTISRYRMQSAVAGAFLLVLVGFGASMSVAYQRARTEANKVRDINVFLEDTLGSVAPGQSGDEVTVRELLDEAVQWIEIALSDQPEVAASIQTTIGNSYRNLGALDEAEIQLQRALNTHRDLFGTEDIQYARSLSHFALLRRDQGHGDEARQLWEESLRIRIDRMGTDNFEVAITYANLGLLQRDQGQLAEAERLIHESLGIRQRLFGSVHQDVAMCHYHLATVAQRQGDMEGAIGQHRMALDMRRRVLHQKHPDLSRSLLALGVLLTHAGRADEAEVLLVECLENRLGALPPGDELIIEARQALASCRELISDDVRDERNASG